MQSRSVNDPVADWADGLPEEVVSAIRQEAIRRGIRTRDLIREWNISAARALTGHSPGTPASRTHFEGLGPEASDDLPV